jgi:hypothetical protein
VSAGVFSKFRIDKEEQRIALSILATCTDITQNDKAILLKAEYYLLTLCMIQSGSAIIA